MKWIEDDGFWCRVCVRTMSARFSSGAMRLLAAKFAIDGVGNIFIDESLPLLTQLRLWIHTSALGCLESRGCRFQSLQLGFSQVFIALVFALVASSSSSTPPLVRLVLLLAGAVLVASVHWSIWIGVGPLDAAHVWMSPPGDLPWAAVQLAVHAVVVVLTLIAAGFEWRRLWSVSTVDEKIESVRQVPNAIAVEAATRARSRSPQRNSKQD